MRRGGGGRGRGEGGEERGREGACYWRGRRKKERERR